jgi:hypothetical protein
MHLARTAAPPIDAWRCVPCGRAGTLDELRATECAHTYPPCEVCGQAPECAADCASVVAALAGAHVVGAPAEVQRELDRMMRRGKS